MNNKENVIVGEGGLSAEQRARISQNLRAAKALLARKRPRQTLNASGDTCEIESQAQIIGIKRLPLSEITKNVAYSKLKRGIKLTNRDCLTQICPEVLAAVKIDDYSTAQTENGILSSFLIPMKQPDNCINISVGPGDDSSEVGKGVFMEGGAEFNSFVTPVRQPGCSGLSQTSSLSSVPDDVFDDSILEEIDALCENSVAKSEREVSKSTPVKSQYDDKSTEENNTCLNLLLSDEKLNNASVSNSSCNHERGPEILSNSETHIKSMPEEYSKYLQSLNDRQQEAACCDISTPLMIVAGPGSGTGINPSHILAMTFTTAAASEMRERIGAVAGKAAAKELTISTFHSFSLQLCRLYADKPKQLGGLLKIAAE